MMAVRRPEKLHKTQSAGAGFGKASMFFFFFLALLPTARDSEKIWASKVIKQNAAAEVNSITRV